MATEAREATGVEVVDLAVTPLRELNQRLHDVARDGGAGALAHREPERRPRGRLPGSTPRSRSRSTGTWATTAPA